MERRLLILSVWATAFFAAMGVIWGIVSGSVMIIFDGLYSLVSVGLSGLSLLVLSHVKSGETERFPFGKTQFEPLLVAFKSITIMSMCAYAAVEAAGALFHGGRVVALDSALVYSIVSVIGCGVTTTFVFRGYRKTGSALLGAEANQWIGDSLLSLCVLLGFFIARFFLADRFPTWVPYVDPSMVVLASAVFLILPGRSLFGAFRELLLVSAEKDVLLSLEKVAEKIAGSLEAEYKLHVIRVGRQLEVEANFLLSEDRAVSISEMDDARARLKRAVEGRSEWIWLNVNYTMDPSEV